MKNYNVEDTEEIELIEIDLDVSEEKTETLQEKNEAAASEWQPIVVDKKGFVRELISYVIVFAVAITAAFLINRFIILNANVPTRSMAPTINAEDKLIGFRLAYIFDEPNRGDVVIFTHKSSDNKAEEEYIKRIIGIPGDTIVITDGILYVNQKPVREEYLGEDMVGSFGPYTVPEDCYFMLGDNRNISEDARYWENTYVNRENIIAKAVFKYNPSFEVIK